MTMTETELLAAIRKSYPGRAYVMLTGVRNGTGFEREARTADAIVMSLWPSRGVELIGFEVKTHRSDWLRELKDGDKAEEIAQFCDYWWVIAPSADVVKVCEVPVMWGLKVMGRKGLVVAKQAKAQITTPITRLFLASLLRNAVERSPEELARKIREADEKGYERAKASIASWRNANDGLRDKIERFRIASGIDIFQAWDGPERIGDAVRWLLEADPGAIIQAVVNVRQRLDTFAEHLKDSERELKAYQECQPRGPRP